MSETVLITGAAGFIGKKLAERLRADGHDVIASDLRPGAGVDEAFDVRDRARVRRVMEDRKPTIVVHCAAVVDDRIDADTTEQINVGGTRSVLDACVAAGVGRLVHLSSIAALGTSPPAGQTDESQPDTAEREPYFGTKARSEALLRRAIREARMPIVIVRPGDVWGPNSGPWVERMVDTMRQRMPVLIDGGRGMMCPCHVENLVDGIVLAMTHEHAPGGVFTFHDGEHRTYRSYVDALAEAAGLGRQRLAMPKPVARALAVVSMRAQRHLGWEALMSTGVVDYMTRPSTYDLEHSRAVLGYEPRVGFAEGMAELRQVLR